MKIGEIMYIIYIVEKCSLKRFDFAYQFNIRQQTAGSEIDISESMYL